MKAGVSGNGEKWSTIAEDDLNARYGRFQTMKLGPSYQQLEISGRRTVLHVIAELDIAVCVLPFLLRVTYVSSESLLINFLTVVADRWG